MEQIPYLRVYGIAMRKGGSVINEPGTDARGLVNSMIVR
jgi:hypothetical protein